MPITYSKLDREARIVVEINRLLVNDLRKCRGKDIVAARWGRPGYPIVVFSDNSRMLFFRMNGEIKSGDIWTGSWSVSGDAGSAIDTMFITQDEYDQLRCIVEQEGL
jgi:hypothetical protein